MTRDTNFSSSWEFSYISTQANLTQTPLTQLSMHSEEDRFLDLASSGPGQSRKPGTLLQPSTRVEWRPSIFSPSQVYQQGVGLVTEYLGLELALILWHAQLPAQSTLSFLQVAPTPRLSHTDIYNHKHQMSYQFKHWNEVKHKRAVTGSKTCLQIMKLCKLASYIKYQSQSYQWKIRLRKLKHLHFYFKKPHQSLTLYYNSVPLAPKTP